MNKDSDSFAGKIAAKLMDFGYTKTLLVEALRLIDEHESQGRPYQLVTNEAKSAIALMENEEESYLLPHFHLYRDDDSDFGPVRESLSCHDFFRLLPIDGRLKMPEKADNVKYVACCPYVEVASKLE